MGMSVVHSTYIACAMTSLSSGSDLAQRKRIGPITQGSVDRNYQSLHQIFLTRSPPRPSGIGQTSPKGNNIVLQQHRSQLTVINYHCRINSVLSLFPPVIAYFGCFNRDMKRS